jgi:hypothetical protein
VSEILSIIVGIIVVAIIGFFATFILYLNLECKEELWEEIERLMEE